MNEKTDEFKNMFKSERVVDENYSFRYRIKKINVNNSNRTMLIILMNPGTTDLTNSENTLSKIFSFGEELYKEILIFNILPLYEPKSTEVSKVRESFISKYGEKMYDKELEYNYSELEQQIKLRKESTDIYLATGNLLTCEGKMIMQKVYDLLKGREVFAFKSVRPDETFGYLKTKKGYTFHPSRQPVSFMTINNRCKFIVKNQKN